MFEAPSTPSLNLIDPELGYSGYTAYTPPPATTTPASYGAPLMYSSMAVSSLGAILTAFGQARAATAQGDYEQGLSRTNATIASIQARQTIEAGDVAASRKDMETQQVVGALRARGGASGVDVNVGSPAAVRTSVAGVGAADELTIRNNAARQAWGFQTEAISDTYKGQFARLTSRSQASQSLLTGGLQAISGPLAIEANYQRFARYMDRYNAVGARGTDLPFPGLN